MTYLGYKKMGVGDDKVVDLEVLLSEAQFDRGTYYGKAIKCGVRWAAKRLRDFWRSAADTTHAPGLH